MFTLAYHKETWSKNKIKVTHISVSLEPKVKYKVGKGILLWDDANFMALYAYSDANDVDYRLMKTK